uniref:Uncharacterized protein n=1 Tax=Cucumis melo TaxID=3656 RepID=A0A9I9E1E7_CUCME
MLCITFILCITVIFSLQHNSTTYTQYTHEVSKLLALPRHNFITSIPITDFNFT